jgi:hypothetical protein
MQKIKNWTTKNEGDFFVKNILKTWSIYMHWQQCKILHVRDQNKGDRKFMMNLNGWNQKDHGTTNW